MTPTTMLPGGCAPPAAARLALRRVESAIICVFGPSFFKYSLPMSKRAKRTVFGQIPDSGVFGRGLRLALRCIASRRIVLQCDALCCVALRLRTAVAAAGVATAIGAATAAATATGVSSLLVLTTTPVGFEPNLQYV